MLGTTIEKSNYLGRTFDAVLEDAGSIYTVIDIRYSAGEQLQAGSLVAVIRQEKTIHRNEKSSTEVSELECKFTRSEYVAPVVSQILVTPGTTLAPGTHAILEYQVEESFGNLIETVVTPAVKTISNLYFGKNIPESKRSNAIAAYAKSVDAERVIFLYDSTFWGGSKEGFLISDSGFYLKDTQAEFYFMFNAVNAVNLLDGESPALELTLKDGTTLTIGKTDCLCLNEFKDFLDAVLLFAAQGLTKDVDGFVIVEDMPEPVKLSYLALLVWLTFQDDAQIDEREVAELQVLMTQINLSAELRQEIRGYMRDASGLSPDDLAQGLIEEAPSGSEEALAISLLKDAIRIHRTTKSTAAKDQPGILKLGTLLHASAEQIAFLEEACTQDEKILRGEISDDQLIASAKDMASKAAAVGVPIAAVYLSGSVVGLSAAGVTSGLATLGLGGVLGLSSMVTGIGVAVLLGVGVYKGLQWVMGSAERDKASRREFMLQEVLRIHQKTIGNLAEDIAYFAERLIDLTRDFNKNALLIEKLQKEISMFVIAMRRLKEKENAFEKDLDAESSKRASA